MGKGRSFSNEANEIIYQTESNNENYALGSQNSYNLGSVHFSDQSGIGNFSQSGTDQKKADIEGVLFRGNIGHVQQTVKLDVGTSTINLNNDSTGASLAVISQDRIVTLSAGFTSDLTTITGAQRQGQVCKLYNIFSNTITIKNNAGATVNTIVTPGAVDFILSGHALVTLAFDISLAQWRIEGNLGSGGTGDMILAAVQTVTGLKTFLDTTIGFRNQANTFTNLFTFPTTAGRIYTFPDVTTTIAGLTGTQTFTGTTTFSAGILFSNSVTFTGTPINFNSSVINLGDQTTDIINFLGKIGTNVDLNTFNINNLDELNQQDTGHTLLHTFARPETLPNDSIIGEIRFRAFDGIGTINNYAMIKGVMDNDANTSEDGRLEFFIVEDGDHNGVKYVDMDGDLKQVQFFRPISMFGNSILLDSDGDTSINSLTDDSIQVITGGALQGTWSNSGLLMGNDINLLDNNLNNINILSFDESGQDIIVDPIGFLFSTNTGDVFDFTIAGSKFTIGETEINCKVDVNMNTNFIQFDGIVVPSTTTGEPKLFADNSNSDHLSVKSGDGSTIDLESAVGGGANTQLSNLSGTVAVNLNLDPGTTNVRDIGNATFRWQEIFVQKINLSAGGGNGFNSNLIPSTGLFTLGDSSNKWLTTFTDRIRLTTNTNTIFESGGNMVINSAADIEFTIGTIAAGKVVSASEWDFQGSVLNGVNAIGFSDGHVLTSLPTELELNLASGEPFVLQNNGTDFASFGETVTVLTNTSTSTVGHILRLRLDSSTPADGDFVGILEFSGRDSSGNNQSYADIAGASLDVTNGTEDGLLALNVRNNGSSAKAFEVSANGGNIGIGFFGTTSIGNSKPTITGSRAGNAALADLLTKLATLGLLTDSTT